jgi:hypothetical protein
VKLQPFVMKDGHYCPDCIVRNAPRGHGTYQRLVFGMRSDGEFPKNKPQKRKRFTLLRPIIATRACKYDGCGYWWPAFSFTPTAPQEVKTA